MRNIVRIMLFPGKGVGATLLCCLALSFPALTFAAQIISVVDIDYVQIKGQPAVSIRFDQPIRYKTHFPTRQGRHLTIQLDLVKPVDSLDNFQNKLRPPPSKQIPLEAISLVAEDGQPAIIMRFARSVSFQVSQTTAMDALTVILPNLKTKTAPLPAADTPEKSPTSANDGIAGKFYREGIKALKKADTKLAIRIFSKVLSISDNSYLQDALELLGVSRERHGQFAQAKLVYRHYLKKYPDGEKHARVKQRLGELMAGEIKPKSRLKNSKSASSKGSKKPSQFTGLLQQTYFNASSSVAGSSSIADESFLSSQVSANWRVREEASDIRSFFYASYDYDDESGESSDLKINTLYSKYRNTDMGLYATIGRQSSVGGGVLGRFDGLYLAYDISSRVKIATSLGSPLEFSRKDRIQTEKVLQSVSVDMEDLIKDWFIAPYYVSQKNRGIKDRQAVGMELRFYSKQGNLYNLIDYDTLFSELNIYLFRGQFNLSANTSLNFSVDKRRTPLLEASNALIGNVDPNLATIDQLAGTISQQELLDRALARSGESTISSLGMTKTIGNEWQVSSDFSLAKSIFKNIVVSSDPAAPASIVESVADRQSFFNLQLVRYKLFQQSDTLILSLRQTDAENYDETMFLLSHRMIFESFRLQSKIRLSNRNSTRQGSPGEIETSKRIKPSVKFDYRKYKGVLLHLNISVEEWKYSGSTNNENFTRMAFDIGYQWSF